MTGRFHEKFGKPNVIQIEFQKYLRDFYNHADVVESVPIPFMREVTQKYGETIIDLKK